MRKYQNKQSGFMLAPLLYMLALGGIGAAVMFSGYSQVLRSNAEMSAVNTVRQQLNSAGQTLSAAAVLDAATSTIVQPPSVLAYGSVSDTSRLPTNYATVNTTGTPQSYGVIDTSTGVRQLDPWGKYYVYCRWENLVSAASSPSILVISAGPDGSLSTKCGDTAAVGDDRINRLTVAEAINRANVWQVNSASQVKFGIAANAVKVNDDGSLTANSLAVGPSASATTGNIVATGSISGASMASTGAITAGSISSTGAISGSTVTGTVTVSSGTSISAGTNITAGGSITATGNMSGANLSTGGTVTATGTITGGNLATGGTVTATGAITGASLTLTTTPLAIASGGTGANTAGGARTSLAVLGIANNLSELTATASTARTNLGLGTMATQNANSVAITGGTISGVTFSGTISGGTYTGSVPFSSITSYPGGTNFLRQDGTWQPVALTGGSTNYLPKWSSASTLTTSSIYQNGTNIGINTTGAAYALDVSGTGRFTSSLYGSAIYTSDWFRVSGGGGIYWEAYGGGFYMSDSTWIRTYNGRYLYASAGYDTGAASAVNCGGGLGAGYTFRVCGTQQVTSTLTVSGGMNTSGRFNLTGSAGDWAQVVNWGPGSVDGYGILVGTGSGKYSQFQNAEGYYTLLANSSWGAYSNGNFGAANFYHVSDRRLKDNIKPSPGLELVMKMKGVSFTWKKDGTKSDGVIAQEIEEVMPESVATDPNGYKTVNYDVIFAPLIESVKELKNMLDNISSKIAELFTRVGNHDAELKALREELKQLHNEFTAYKAAHQ